MPDKGLLDQLRAAKAAKEAAAETPAETPAENSGGSLLDQLRAAKAQKSDIPPGEVENVPRGTFDVDMDNLSKRIADVESKGNYKAVNPFSTATGKYQFLWGKKPGLGHGDEIKELTGVKSREDFLNNPQAQEDYFQHYAENDLKPAVERLSAYNRAGYSDTQLGMLYHFKGNAGKQFLLNGSDLTQANNISIAKYLGPPENAVPHSMQAATTGEDPKTVHSELQNSTETINNFFFPHKFDPNEVVTDNIKDVPKGNFPILPKPHDQILQDGKPIDTSKYNSAFADNVMNANKNLNFVKRFQNPDSYPVVNNSDGSYSTHKMESSDNFVYPTIIQQPDGSLKELHGKEAYNYAMKSGEYIQMPDEKSAEWMANNGYKLANQYPGVANSGTANMDKAKQATQNEINAGKNYIENFYKQNPKMQEAGSVPALETDGAQKAPDANVSMPAATSLPGHLDSIVNPDGDVDALSKFSGSALSLIADKKKKDIADLDASYPFAQQSTAYGVKDEFAAPVAERTDKAGYDAAVAQINKKYNQDAVNLKSSIAGVAQVKVANQFIKQHGISKPITPKDAQEVGWNYMQAVGDGESVIRQKHLDAQDLLSPNEKMEAQRIGYKALQFKMMDAVANGQDAVSVPLANAVAGYPQKIRDANPEAIKENLVNALSNAVNEDDKTNMFSDMPGKQLAAGLVNLVKGAVGRLGFSPSTETMNKAAEKLGIPQSTLDHYKIDPSDLKVKSFGFLGQAASGLISTVAAPLYEGTFRHIIAPLYNQGSVDGNNYISDEALNKRFDNNWYDNSSVSHFVGGQNTATDDLFQRGSKINTDPNSEDYLMEKDNPNAGKWAGDFSNIMGVIANGLGGLSGFASGIGAASGLAEVAGYSKKASDLIGLSTYMYLSGFDNNKKEATSALIDKGAAFTTQEHIEDNEMKAFWLANLYTAADIVGMEIVKPVKQLENVFGKTVLNGGDLVSKLAKGGIEKMTKEDIAKTFAHGLKNSGIAYTEMTGGMSAITAGRYLADAVLAPKKFENDDNAQGLLQSTVHAAIINVIPSLVGGFNVARQEGPLMRRALYEVGSNPRPYMDAIDAQVTAGTMDEDKAAKQKQVVNTLKNIVDNSVPDISPLNKKYLTTEQKQDYAVNLFNESVLATKKKVVDDKVQIEHIESYIKELHGERKEILENAGTVEYTPESFAEFKADPKNRSVLFNKEQKEYYEKNKKAVDAIIKDQYPEYAEFVGLKKKVDESSPEGQLIKQRQQEHAQVGVVPQIIDKGTGKPISQESSVRVDGLIDEAVSKSQTPEAAISAIDQLGYKIAGNPGEISDFVSQKIEGKNDQTFSEWAKEYSDKHDEINARYDEQLAGLKKAEPDVNTEAAVSEQSVANEQEAKHDHISVGELIDKPVTYKGQEGKLFQDGQTVVVSVGNREYELGNIDEIKDHSIKDYGIEQKISKEPEGKSVVNVNDAGNIEVRGQEYVNSYSDPLAAINTDKDGNRSVTLETADGKKRTFRGNVGEDIAYQLHLHKIDKGNEREKLEHFINTDGESKDEIESAIEPESEPETVASAEQRSGESEPVADADHGGSKEVTGEGSAEDTGKVPEVSAEAKPAEKTGEEKIAEEPAPKVESEEKKPRKKLSKKEAVLPPSDLFAPENIEAENERKKWLEENPEFADVKDEPEFIPKPSTKSETGLFSPENKAAVAEQKTEAQQQLERAKNSAPQGNAIPQSELAANFFGAERTPAEIEESNKVGDNVKNKFNSAEKIVGNDRTRVLADGTKIKGKYVLVDANGITPSHDPNKGFQSSEGFPMLEDGRNPNDRDYTQKDVSGKVKIRANKYDGQAVENVPTVDKNGIVIDGNDRTMAGQIAARNRTDKAYLEVLRDNAANYGFTPEQVDAMIKNGLHPRIVFVPDGIPSYNTETFASFNPRTQGKVKNNIENAITLGRTAPGELVDRLGSIMDGFETTSKFFNSALAMRDVRALLERYKIVNNDNVNEYFSSPTSMTNHGKELLQNLMLGKTFGEAELRLLQNHADIREKMVYSMNNILGIEALGEKYSLKGFFDEALHLWDVVERYKEDKGLKSMGEAIDYYFMQGNVHGENFSDEARMLFTELDSPKKSSLRELTRDYLESAKKYAHTEEDMFGEKNPTREKLLNDYAELREKKQREFELARQASPEQPIEQIPGEAERGVSEGDRGAAESGTEGEQGNPDQSTGSGPEDNANTVGGVDYTDTPDLTSLFVSEPMPEYGKEEPVSTEPERKQNSDAYSAAILDHRKHLENEKTVQAKIDGLENEINDMKRNRESGSDAFKQKALDLARQKAVLKQIGLKKKAAELAMRKASGKRTSDDIKALKKKIADDLTLSVPGISPAHFKAMIDFIAGAVKIGENIHDAILNAVIKFKERNPDLKFDEDKLVDSLKAHIDNAIPERDINDRPQLSDVNKKWADAMIGKIKSDPSYKAEFMKKLLEHPSIQSGTKKAISDYVEFYTRHEDTLTKDQDNPHFIDDFKLTTSDETGKFVSGKTIFDIFGEAPKGDQDYTVAKLADMVDDGESMVELAKQHFGTDVMQWGPKLLDAVKQMSSADTPKKAILLATMQGSLREEMLRHPEREGQIRSVLNATEHYWQHFIRKSALDLVAARILRLFRDKNLSEFYADKILTDKERTSRDEHERRLRDEKITDEDAAEGPLRDRDAAIADLQAENDRLKKELTEKPAGNKGKASKREEWAKKAQSIMKDSEVGNLIEDIKDQIKKIKC